MRGRGDLRLVNALAGDVLGDEREDLHRRTGLAYLVLNVLFLLSEAARKATAFVVSVHLLVRQS